MSEGNGGQGPGFRVQGSEEQPKQGSWAGNQPEGRSEKVMAAVMAAVEAYLEQEGRPGVTGPLTHSPIGWWKLTKWRTLRDSEPRNPNTWKYS